MATKKPHTSFRLSGEGREFLALLAQLDGVNMTQELEILIREKVDRVSREVKRVR